MHARQNGHTIRTGSDSNITGAAPSARVRLPLSRPAWPETTKKDVSTPPKKNLKCERSGNRATIPALNDLDSKGVRCTSDELTGITQRPVCMSS